MWEEFIKMIFVTLGSQKFQFNRLLKAIDGLEVEEEIFAQIGYSDYIPVNYSYKTFLDRNEFNEITYLEKIGIWFIKYKEEKEELQRLKNNIFESYKDEKENIILYKKIIDAIKNLETDELELTVEYNNVQSKFLYPKSSIMNFEVFDWYGDFDVNNIKKIEDRLKYQKLKLNKDDEKYLIKHIEMIKVNDDIVYIK